MRIGLTIGGLARAADVPVSTVRYYERVGLLRPHQRSAGNYRLYGPDDVERLRFIRAAQATGFTLEGVREVLRPASCGRVQGLIEERIREVKTRMRDLRRVDRVLRQSLRLCRQHEPTGRCAVVERIGARARS